MNQRDQRKQLLIDLRQNGVITFYDKRAVGRWNDTLNEMEAEGLISREIRELDSQSSCLEVRLL